MWSGFSRWIHKLFFPLAQQPPVGQGFLSSEASRWHSDTPQSVGLLWTSDQSNTETSTYQHTTLTEDWHPCPQRDSSLQSQLASGRRHALDRAATGIGQFKFRFLFYHPELVWFLGSRVEENTELGKKKLLRDHWLHEGMGFYSYVWFGQCDMLFCSVVRF
jgi:hypothetical protein